MVIAEEEVRGEGDEGESEWRRKGGKRTDREEF